MKIRTSTSRTNRPISRLYVLEISYEEDSEQTSQHAMDDQKAAGDSVSSQYTNSQDINSTRTASLKACVKLTEWINSLRGPQEDVKDWLLHY